MTKRIVGSTLVAALAAAFIALPAVASEPGDPPRHIPWTWDDLEETPRQTRAETEQQRQVEKAQAQHVRAEAPRGENTGELGW